ncbi:hypothetical protein LMC14_02750 [Neisseria gonorrhoeae]|nr:hypothetical protein [Neisseria gonorrhoeae]
MENDPDKIGGLTVWMIFAASSKVRLILFNGFSGIGSWGNYRQCGKPGNLCGSTENFTGYSQFRKFKSEAQLAAASLLQDSAFAVKTASIPPDNGLMPIRI